MDGDSWDWIANGLRLAGARVRSSGRPLLLPAVIALLDRWSALPWLPVLLQVLFLGTVLAFYGVAARLAPRRAAFAAALALLLGHALRGMALQIMADVPASCLLFLFARSFLLAGIEESPRRYLASGAWGAASALAQPVALLSLLPAGVTVFAHRRSHLRSPWLAAGAGMFVAVPALAWAAQRLLAAAGDPVLLHARLLRPHADAVFFYLWSAAAFFGLPGILLLATGTGIAARRAWRDGSRLFVVSLIAVLLAFFVFLYDFNAERFLVYVAWPAGLLIAEALGRLRRSVPFAAAATLLVAGAALPPVYAHASFQAGASGSPRLDPAAISLRTFHVADLARFSIPGRVWAARETPPADRLSPQAVAADASALFVAADPSDGGGRYRTITRLGNALRKRVKFVPGSWLVAWLPRLGVTPVGTIGPDYAVFRARLPGRSGSWLLVTSAGSPLRPKLEGLAGSVPAPFDAGLRAGLARALEVQRLIAGSDGYVALLPSTDPLRLYFPFLLATTELYVIEPQDEQETLAALASAPVLGEDRARGTVVRRIVYLGRRAAVITETATPPR